MEFLFKQSRCNGSKRFLSTYSKSRRKNVGLLIFNNKPFNSTHIVFSTHNLTKSLTKPAPSTTSPSQHDSTPRNSTTSPSQNDSTPRNNPVVGTFFHTRLQNPCLLLSHSLGPGNTGSSKPGRFDHTLNLLPLTVCTKHETSGFLPYDYVRRMAEYTCTSKYKNSTFKVLHSFEDCILEFPLPAPISSSEEVYYTGRNYLRYCYQCLVVLSNRRTVYMYRDYLFCSHGCRMKACATKYWYAKMMQLSDDDCEQDIFFIEI